MRNLMRIAIIINIIIMIMVTLPLRHMRQELGITSDAYLSSICSGNMNISPTAGRSGALFIVPDGGFVRLKVCCPQIHNRIYV